MTTTETKWLRGERRTAYDGRVVVAECDAALPTGERTTFEVDESIPFAVAVLLSDGAGSVWLTRQYRFALDAWIYDLPGGAGQVGEDPARAAARECEEETGILPDSLTPLHTFFPNPGRAAWPSHLFFAEAGAPGRADRSDPSEQVQAVRIPIDDLDSLIRAGSIVDPSLLIARTFAALRGFLPPLPP